MNLIYIYIYIYIERERERERERRLMQGCREGWSINSRPAQSANALIYIYIYI